MRNNWLLDSFKMLLSKTYFSAVEKTLLAMNFYFSLLDDLIAISQLPNSKRMSSISSVKKRIAEKQQIDVLKYHIIIEPRN